MYSAIYALLIARKLLSDATAVDTHVIVCLCVCVCMCVCVCVYMCVCICVFVCLLSQWSATYKNILT
jgi:hypothetical protein